MSSIQHWPCCTEDIVSKKKQDKKLMLLLSVKIQIIGEICAVEIVF